MGHERSNISKAIKAMGLKSNFSASEKTILISPKNEVLEFESRELAAKYLIENKITRSKNIANVAGMIGERKYDKKPYYGYYCK